MKAKKFIFITVLIFILVLICFSGCGNVQKENDETNSAERVIIDQVGREVTLPAEINRVVTTFRPVTFFTFAIGGQEKLAAVDNHSPHDQFLKGVYPEIANLPTIGDKKSGYNLEEIVAVDPDVVILHSGKGMDEFYEQLKSQGIAAITIVPESIEEMKEAAKLLGVVYNKEDQATEVINYYDNILALIDEKISNISQEERKNVFMTGSETLSTVSKDLYQNYLIEAAGGVSVSKDMTGYFPKISAEQLVKWNPDYIFSIYHNAEGTVESIMTNPQFSSINAVKNNNVYKFPSILGAWDYPEPRSALGLLWLSTKLYPQQLADIDLLKEVNDFHKKFYGKTYEELGGTEAELLGK